MTFNYLNFCLLFFISMIPIYVLKKQEVIEKKKFGINILYSVIWGVISFLLSFLILTMANAKISYETLVLSSVVCTFFNYLLLDDKINIKVVARSFLIFVGFFFSSLFQLIPIFIFNIDLNKASVNTQVLLTLFSDFCFISILLLIYFKSLKKDFLVFKKKFNEYMDGAFKYYFIGLLVMVVSNVLINLLSPSNISSNEESIQNMIKASPYLTLICTGILAPFIEELVFRKAFREAFNNKYLFIFISSLVFGGLHVVLSIRGLYDLLYLIPYCSLGFSFAIIYSKYDNIFPTIMIHAIHNSVITIISIMSLMVIL